MFNAPIVDDQLAFRVPGEYQFEDPDITYTRLEPLDMAGRQAWEDGIFFGGWLLLIGAAFFGRSPQWAARWQLVLADLLSLLVPVASSLGTNAWPWTSAANGWWGVFWIDVGFIIGGALLLWMARGSLLRKQTPSTHR